MRQLGLVLARELGDDPLGEHLAKLDSPLVKRVDLPDRALCENTVLIERDQGAQNLRSEPLRQNDVGRAVSLNVRCGTSQSGVPSALTSSDVLPKAKASAWANTLDIKMSW